MNRQECDTVLRYGYGQKVGRYQPTEFDYGEAAKKVHLPPTLYIAAIDDPCLGH